MLVSFLRAQGHPSAARYPLCTLFTEARIAKHRINMEFVTQAILTKEAITAVLGGKDGIKAFNQTTERLTDGP